MVLISRNALLIGNSSDTGAEKAIIPEVSCGTIPTGDDSKIVYINDSYNLDSIPFDVETIIDSDNIEDTV
jgi:hypothetical protein